jgi:hypothetical protein
MGLLDRIRVQNVPQTGVSEPPNTPWAIQTFSGLRLYPLPVGALLGVTGERHHQQAVAATLKRASTVPPTGLDSYAQGVATQEAGALRWFTAELIHTPENRYDKNAIEVRTTQGLVGYLDRDHAEEFRPVFELLKGEGYGGALVPAFGRPDEGQIVLCLSWAAFCEKELQEKIRYHGAWTALTAGEEAKAVAERYGYKTAGGFRRAVNHYAEQHDLAMLPGSD